MIENHKDVEATKAARRAGEISDPRSYISIAGHIYLRGQDRSRLRELVYVDAKGFCAVCRAFRHRSQGDMDHIQGGRKHIRCDCWDRKLANGAICRNVRWICSIRLYERGCHAKKHHRTIG